MSISIYLQILNPTIAGSSTVAYAKGDFDIGSLSFGGVAPTETTMTMTQVTFTLPAYAMPSLMQAMEKGTPHTLTFNIYSGGGGTISQSTIFQTIVLTDAFFTMIQQSATNGDGLPSVEISCNFKTFTLTEATDKITYTYPLHA